MTVRGVWHSVTWGKMNILKDNKDLACFYTTKHSWRGKYKRVFSVGTHGVTTYNPTTLEVTNQVSTNKSGLAETLRSYRSLSLLSLASC
ncbi:hypothetical protein XENOCAPTIV_000200 [Xenoophorus captivus]|uniref:DnaJ homologue subfamily C GRV2/DNAJC13 N-terminal domain-containing protein n=1 Tax=Xenoophorus captivus TaxID=1517983 RepID=A0ABV0RL61_9TELE